MRLVTARFFAVVAISLVALMCACSRNPEALKKEHFDKGSAYFARGKYAEAAIEFQNAIEIDSQYAVAHYQYAKTLAKLGNWPRAYQELSTAATLDPSNTKVQLDLANLLVAAGKPIDARTTRKRS